MSKSKGYKPYRKSRINMGFKIDELNISDDLPDWVCQETSESELLTMIKNNIKNQEADLTLLKLYVNKLKDRYPLNNEE
jgi:hypothetical protein